MGGEGDAIAGLVVQGEQRIVQRQWLVEEYVERNPADAMICDRAGQCRLIDQLAAGGIDEEGGWFHQADLARADDSLGLFVERQLHGQNVGLPEHFVPRHIAQTVAFFEVGKPLDIPIDRGHSERLGIACDRPGDLAHTEDAEGDIARILNPGIESPVFGILAAAHPFPQRGQSLEPVQHERPNMLRHGDVVDQRGSGRRHAKLAGRLDRHTAMVLTQMLHQPQLLRSQQRFRRQLLLVQHQVVGIDDLGRDVIDRFGETQIGLVILVELPECAICRIGAVEPDQLDLVVGKQLAEALGPFRSGGILSQKMLDLVRFPARPRSHPQQGIADAVPNDDLHLVLCHLALPRTISVHVPEATASPVAAPTSVMLLLSLAGRAGRRWSTIHRR